MRTDDFWDALVYGVSWSKLSMEDVMSGDAKKREIRVGDKYDIPVEVVEVRANVPQRTVRYWVAVRSRPDLARWVCGATLDASRLVEATPEPLKVGDKVTHVNGTWSGKILAIHEDEAWVEVGIGVTVVRPSYNISDLRRG